MVQKSKLKEIIEREEQGMVKEVKLVVDGKEFVLQPDGDTKQFFKFKEPGGQVTGEDGKVPVMAKVYIHRDFKAG